MIKKLIFAGLILCCTFFSSCNNKISVKNDYEKLNLKGKPKRIVETYYSPEVSGDTIKQGERTSAIPAFLEFSEELFISYETKLYFNSDGNIAECTMVDSTSEFGFRELFEYDNILLTSKVGLLTDEFFYKQVFEYDSQNREKSRNFYDEKDHLFESVSIDYIDKNNIVESVFTEESQGGTNFERKIVLENGLPVSSTSVAKSAQIERWTGQYNSTGQLISSELFDNTNAMTQRNKYEYDEFGNVTKYSVYSPDDELFVDYIYMYKYDEHNNWVQRASISENYPEVITVRELVYE